MIVIFRCVTQLKGLVIDIDSFFDIDIIKWEDLFKTYKCLFFVSDDAISQKLSDYYTDNFIYKIERFRKPFAPNEKTHQEILNLLGLQSTEIAYVSANYSFLKNAMSFLGGTIGIMNKISYEESSKAPDLICHEFDEFKNLMENNIKGFLGETAIFPCEDPKGMIITLQINVDGNNIPIFMLGRYFGYSHYMNQLHPYSTAIYLNKKDGKSYYRKFDNIFAAIYICAIKRIQKINAIDGIVAVPTRPGKENRYDKILEVIAQNCDINNYGDYFKCVQNYPTQKNLSSLERQDNISGVFKCQNSLTGKKIVIIDDIITTGATIKESIRTLMAVGVELVFIVVLGINQPHGHYWSSNIPQVTCPECNDKMHLLVNGNNRNFFYSCFSCKKTLSFESGREILCNNVNSEFK